MSRTRYPSSGSDPGAEDAAEPVNRRWPDGLNSLPRLVAPGRAKRPKRFSARFMTEICK